MVMVTEAAAPPVFEWKRWPEAEAFVNRLIATALAGSDFAQGLAERMPGETGTRFSVWVDHLLVDGAPDCPDCSRHWVTSASRSDTR